MRGITRQLRLFFTALQFFTRLPIPQWVGYDEAWMQPAIRYFPLIGWLTAAVAAGVYWLAGMIWPASIAALLSTVAGVLLTGALHEDGFADVCDGFGGGTSAERVLTIMKDSRVGAYGVIGIVLVLALKIAALAAMPAQQAIVALCIAQPLSRAFAAIPVWRLDYVRMEGKAKAMAQRMQPGEFAFSALCGVFPMLIGIASGVIGWQKCMAAAILAAFACLYLVLLFLRRLGGYTGDCLGAIQQTSEVCVYLALLVV